MQIKDKCVLLTGGSNGIGYLCVKELLRHGAKRVVILDKAKSQGIDAVEKLTKEFGKDRANFLFCDVTNEAEFTENFEKAIKMCQGLDIVVNNAGILDEKRWELMIDINFKAVVRGTILAMNHMGKHKGGKGGTILNLGSVTSLKSFEELPIYSGSKCAVLGFSQGIGDFFEETGVRVLTICPGVTTTTLLTEVADKVMDFVDEERVNKNLLTYPTQPPEVVADAMVKLIEKGESGAVWVIEGGEPPYAVKMPHYSTCRVPI